MTNIPHHALIERLRKFSARPADESSRGFIGTYIDLCQKAAAALESANEVYWGMVADRLRADLATLESRAPAGALIERLARIIHDECEGVTGPNDDSEGGAYMRAARRVAAALEPAGEM